MQPNLNRWLFRELPVYRSCTRAFRVMNEFANGRGGGIERKDNNKNQDIFEGTAKS